VFLREFMLSFGNELFVMFIRSLPRSPLGTGAWESALTNTLSPGDKIISFLLGQFSLLWIDQMQRYNFDVDVIECEWGDGADLELLKQKLQSDYSHSVKAICVVHNETSTGVTNDIGAVRQVLGNTTFLTSFS